MPLCSVKPHQARLFLENRNCSETKIPIHGEQKPKENKARSRRLMTHVKMRINPKEKGLNYHIRKG